MQGNPQEAHYLCTFTLGIHHKKLHAFAVFLLVMNLVWQVR